LHDMEAVVLELLEKSRQRFRRCWMDIVQEQNAFAERLKPAHRQRDDLTGLDMAMPVVGVRVGREDGQSARGEFAFDKVGAGKAGDAEERCEIFGIAKGGADVGNAPVDFVAHFRDRQLPEARWMVLAMRADRMAFLVNAAHNGGIGAGHFADHEVRHLHALRNEDVEDFVGIGRYRAVIESENDFLVIERQRVGILRVANPRILGGIEREHAARAKRVRMSGTVRIRWCGVVVVRLSRGLSGGRDLRLNLGGDQRLVLSRGLRLDLSRNLGLILS